MLNALIDFSLKNRFVVLLLAGLLIVIGVRSASTPAARRLPRHDPGAGPDQHRRSRAVARRGRAAHHLPRRIRPGRAQRARTRSAPSRKFGFSQVVAIFADGTDIYFARQQVNERLGEAKLPEGIGRPAMGPVATGLGEVYHYLLTSENPEYGLTELRTLQDWVIRPRLRRVPGVAEINAWGGLEKQFEAQADPAKLAKHGLTLDDVMRALRQNNQNVGGGYVIRSGEASLVQGIARTTSVEQIADIVIESHDGVPIRVRDVADVEIGHAIRRGGVTAEGKGEAVLGLAFMRMGENSRDVTNALDRAMDDVKKSLPPGVTIRVVYKRTDLVDAVLKTVERNLFEGAILVIAVLFAFLGNLRAGLIVASAIPLSMLFAVTVMERIGIAGSLMSLGAIDFGLVVDSSVVMVENCVRRLAHDRSNRTEARHHPRRRRRGEKADHVRRTHHHDCVFADSNPGGHRRETVPADGPDGHLRPRRIARAVAHPHAGPRLARPAAKDRRTRKHSLTASPTRCSSRSSAGDCGIRFRRSPGRCPDGRRRRCSAYGSGRSSSPA